MTFACEPVTKLKIAISLSEHQNDGDVIAKIIAFHYFMPTTVQMGSKSATTKISHYNKLATSS